MSSLVTNSTDDGNRSFTLNYPKNKFALTYLSIHTGHPTWSLLWPAKPSRVRYTASTKFSKFHRFSPDLTNTDRISLRPNNDIDIIWMWLPQCSDEHDHDLCRRTATHKLPTRLLSIRDNSVNLVISTDLHEKPRYATLTYCWGCRPFTKLTSDNYNTFTNNTLLESLPETIRIAIDYTRRFGLGYIWIDAFCIIQQLEGQDDNPDCLHETGRMQFVHGGSYINMAVSSSISVYETFPCQKNSYSCGFRVQVRTQDRVSRLQGFYGPDTVEAMY